MAQRKPPPATAGPVMRRGRGARAIAAVLPKITAGTLRRRGFAEAGVIADWPTIIGPRLAAGCGPEKLVFARGKRAEGTLHLRVAGALATELQHLEPQLLERINGYFGYRAVARLRFVQGPLPTPPARPEPTMRPLTAEETTALHGTLSGISGDRLRAALERLGRAVIGRVTRPAPEE